jgi:phospholipid/cholesterol/gamma-HCH transport system substrate-binding protein
VADKHHTELAVGIFVIIAVLIVMFLIVQMGERLFVSEYQVAAYFENAAGLSPGVTVTLAGVPVGKVRRIKLLTPKEVGELGRKGTLVRVELLIERKFGIPIDSELVLTRTALLGEQSLMFSETDTMKYFPKDGSAMVWNTRLPPGPTEEISAIFEDIKKGFGELIGNINLVLGDEEFRRGLIATTVNAAVVTDKAKVLVDDAAAAARSMNAFLVSANNVAAQLDESIRNKEGLAGALMSDEEFADDVKEIVRSLGGAAAELHDAILRGSAAADEIRKLGSFYRRNPSAVIWGASSTGGVRYVPQPVEGP